VDTPLAWLTNQPAQTLEAELIGGNLALWSALAGTPYAASGQDRFIFLEDTDEPFYRIDRMMTQLVQSGAFTGVKALVLGDFTNCTDESNTCLAFPDSTERKPLRQTFTQPQAFDQIFTPIGKQLNLPIATGLVVGHGPHFAPLPLGARYRISPDGKLQLQQWDWLGDNVTLA
jgi:muramoyltetrapeptide carboxypeptidase